MVNLSAFIRFHAERTPERPAILYRKQRIDYAELHQRTLGLAGFLAGRGIGAGDVVAVLMKNSPAFVEAALATSYLGAVFLPINFRLAAAEVEYIVGDSGAKLLLVDDELAAAAAAVPAHLTLEPEAQADSRRLGEAATVPAQCYRQPDDLFRLMYTSGTTDHPKGVMHTYSNFYWKSADHVVALGLGAEDRLLVVGPLYHAGAFDLPGFAVLWVGGTLCIERDFDAAAALGRIEEHGLTGAWLAPVMLNAVLSLPERQSFDLSSLAWVVGGGERTPEQRIVEFTDLFKAGRYIDAYGLTESCSGDTLMEAGREIEKIGSTGRALAHVQVRILDDAGQPLAAGIEGEICLRGPKITRGYWNAPEKTAESFTSDGWFRTGDVGHLDEEGFLYLTDRKKDLIISGGENIASSEVERVVYDLGQVSEAAVVGLPDPDWGERPVAVVVLRPGTELALDELTAHCRQHLAGFKVPKQLIVLDELPRNPSGKVLKRELRTRLAATPE
ncbi:MAG: AMP-binding protein [Alphaproteobacteria bacterium]|nr:AMP-binding protein [Alphaproteobacteria bacterium]